MVIKHDSDLYPEKCNSFLHHCKFIFENLEETLVFIGSLIITITLFIQVVNRFIFKFPLPWTEELARYTFVITTLFAISFGIKRNSHVGIDLLVNLLHPPFRKVICSINFIICIILAIFIVITGYQMTMNLKVLGQTSPVLRIPMWSVYGFIPLTFFLIILRLISNIKNIWVKGE